ncbi:short chain dehydrogenase/reductase [Macrophomina phaseolina]|uniref:Short chain dehydrogenase/reductase n=1 Tax=Macrophomina phaseolina TaxID=35725 RepID=A0ABQ8FT44_9PEZI|nr:short chain dehydrogenase/reductase [Macrophomina phaseolina]
MAREVPRYVLITGCSPGGIGFALAQEFAKKGFTIIATARSSAALDALQTCPFAESVIPFELDVTSADSISRLRRAVEALLATAGGALAFLVNNAGMSYSMPALHLDDARTAQVFETNTFGAMRMCTAFAPLMIASGRGGTIVQIGSVAGIVPYVFGSAYNASKAALHAYSDTLRLELAPFGVAVVVACTGGVRSNISARPRSIPASPSFYPKAVREAFSAQRYSQAGGMSAERYAESLVRQLLARRGRGPRSGWIWEGGKAWAVWALHTFFPRLVMDVIFSRMYGLSKMERSRPIRGR